MESNKKTVAGNRGYRGEISFTNIRINSGGLGLVGRKLQIIDFHEENYKKSNVTLETRKKTFETNAVEIVNGIARGQGNGGCVFRCGCCWASMVSHRSTS